jgi:hypothetical protein
MCRRTASGSNTYAFGKRTDRPLLLLMGLGAQMIHWRQEFCERRERRSFRRALRQSRRLLDEIRLGRFARHRRDHDADGAGEPVSAPYTLNDMADDGMLMDALDLPTAHICGASMGGMIVKRWRYGNRDASRASRRSVGTGNRELPPEAGGDGGADSRRNESRGSDPAIDGRFEGDRQPGVSRRSCRNAARSRPMSGRSIRWALRGTWQPLRRTAIASKRCRSSMCPRS